MVKRRGKRRAFHTRGAARSRDAAHRPATTHDVSLHRSLTVTLEGRIARALIAEAASLGAHWLAQAPSVAPRTAAEVAPVVDPAQSERTVRSLACALRNDPGCYDDVMRAGWDLGHSSHVAGTSLHFMLKELGLLDAIVLYACERALRDAAADDTTDGAGPAQGIAIARRLQKFFSLLTLAAAKGFTHAYLDDLQEHYRVLRHDLRNPLGTIRSAVSLMEDESVPPEMRNNPRFRAMVTRNATSLDAVIGTGLSDASIEGSAFSQQEVSLRGMALAVRRDLRDEAAGCGCEIIVSDEMPAVLIDSTGFDLALKSVVTGALEVARAGSVIEIAFSELSARAATVRVSFDVRDDAPVRDAARALAFAAEVLARTGGRVWADGVVWMEVPVLTAHAGDDLARPG